MLEAVALWATYVVFAVVGRDYEGAVSAGAFCGFAMGATATTIAIANMQAITRRHGPAPTSFVVVPIGVLRRPDEPGRADVLSLAGVAP